MQSGKVAPRDSGMGLLGNRKLPGDDDTLLVGVGDAGAPAPTSMSARSTNCAADAVDEPDRTIRR